MRIFKKHFLDWTTWKKTFILIIHKTHNNIVICYIHRWNGWRSGVFRLRRCGTLLEWWSSNHVGGGAHSWTLLIFIYSVLCHYWRRLVGKMLSGAIYICNLVRLYITSNHWSWPYRLLIQQFLFWNYVIFFNIYCYSLIFKWFKWLNTKLNYQNEVSKICTQNS